MRLLYIPAGRRISHARGAAQPSNVVQCTTNHRVPPAMVGHAFSVAIQQVCRHVPNRQVCRRCYCLSNERCRGNVATRRRENIRGPKFSNSNCVQACWVMLVFPRTPSRPVMRVQQAANAARRRGAAAVYARVRVRVARGVMQLCVRRGRRAAVRSVKPAPHKGVLHVISTSSALTVIRAAER